jgi:two-component system chemotaxis sensor kinase CheA
MVAAHPSDKGRVDDLTQEFLVESQDCLDRMEGALTALEQRPGDEDLLAEIFRAVHTIKGATGFLALPRLERLAHVGEHLLGQVRDHRIAVSAPVVDAMLALLDGLRNILGIIEATGDEGRRAVDHDSVLIARLEALSAGEAAPAAAKPTRVERAERSHIGALVEQTLRVDVEVLNQMMNLVGELVLTRNQILQTTSEREVSQGLSRRLDSVTADLRETVMRARTQPVGHLFQKFPRLVRDLAQSCGRCVRLELEGQETRLDKSLLETLKDPITHAVRNAIDHGIEAPAERVRLGKAPEGTVRLAAFHERGQVVIEIGDDGAGMSAERITARAMDRGLLSAKCAQELTPREALELVFLPGFSTRDEVTMVSGRGVGMDVVRANVESVGGVVELESVPGEGSTLRFRVPLTLAIVPALVVRAGGITYAIPRSAVCELMVVNRREEQRLVQKIGTSSLLRLRNELLPLVSLAGLMQLRRDDANGYYVVVLESKGRRFGLMVDDLLDPQEIVVKPLSQVLRGPGAFSGASVLGNGELALILDVTGIGTLAGLEAATAESHGKNAAAEPQPLDEQPKTELLVFENARGERQAMPVSAVERIERIARECIEMCDNAPMLQYRGGLVPLEDLSGILSSGAETVTVIICRRHTAGEARVGIVVARVVDIAGGEILREGQSRIALVSKRLTALHADFRENARENARDISRDNRTLKDVA